MGRDSSKRNITFSQKISNADNVGDTMLSSHKEARQRAIAAKTTPTSVDSQPAAATTTTASAKRKKNVVELTSSDDETVSAPKG
jgi:hypothetical protein